MTLKTSSPVLVADTVFWSIILLFDMKLRNSESNQLEIGIATEIMSRERIKNIEDSDISTDF